VTDRRTDRIAIAKTGRATAVAAVACKSQPAKHILQKIASQIDTKTEIFSDLLISFAQVRTITVMVKEAIASALKVSLKWTKEYTVQ